MSVPEIEEAEDLLLPLVQAARATHPSMGVKKLVGEIKRANPTLNVSAKEVRLALNQLVLWRRGARPRRRSWRLPARKEGH